MKLDRDILTIVCSSNQKYIPYLKTFLNSILINSPSVNIVARLVNVDSETKKELRKKFKSLNLYIMNDNKKINNKKVIKPEIGEFGYQELLSLVRSKNNNLITNSEGVYCSNIKFNTINKLLNKDFKNIVYLDVDTIVRKDISILKDNLQNYDIGMFINEDELDCYSGWNAGIMLIRNTNASKMMYLLIEKFVNDKFWDVDADEEVFDKIYNEHKEVLKLYKVEKTFKDNGPNYDIDSHMWSGQSQEKVLNDSYKIESKKYEIS
tara:strand:- start:216 stop:1007 length:792 start_codon:yes stop_codon:yes gene_type:complete